jgi:hypothetical protein
MGSGQFTKVKRTVASVLEWSDMSTGGLLFQCHIGATCLQADCCFSVILERHVYKRTVVSVSEWSDMSTGGLLFQCHSGATCLQADCCFGVRVERHV